MVLLSLLGVFVMQYLSVSIYLMMEYAVSFGEAFAYTMEELLNLEGFMLMAQDSLVPILFMLLGVFIAWNYVKKTNTGTVQQIEAVQSTLRPNPNGGVQLNLRSDVMAQFGDAIRDTVLEELKKFDLNDVVVDVEDKGALDFVIRSRLQCAICRSAEIFYNWAEEDGHGKQ